VTGGGVNGNHFGSDQTRPAGIDVPVFVQLGVESCHHLELIILIQIEAIIRINVGGKVVFLLVKFRYSCVSRSGIRNRQRVWIAGNIITVGGLSMTGIVLVSNPVVSTSVDIPVLQRRIGHLSLVIIIVRVVFLLSSLP